MKTLKYFFILTAGLIFLNASAQDNYRAVHWDVEDGLSHAIISYMLRDVQGFLWISTDYGLSRFDGNTFKNYYSGNDKRTSITDNLVYGLVEDSLHNIWIGSRKGLSRYDICADTFSHFFSGATSGFIDPFSATKDEVYCIEQNFVITSYNVHSFAKKIRTNIHSSQTLQLNDNARSVIYEYASNSVWILQGYIGQPDCGLFRVSLTEGSTDRYTWNCFRNIPDIPTMLKVCDMMSKEIVFG